MKVLFATSEIAPWIKTGGLGDVAAALPNALLAQGVDVRVLIPYYPALRNAFPDARGVVSIPPIGQLPGALVREARTVEGVLLYLLECDVMFDRPGNPYLGPDGRDWHDNGTRFGVLAHAAAWLAQQSSSLSWQPDVLHCNDWQTALAPAYLRYCYAGSGRIVATVLTVHNLAFQGLFGRDLLAPLGLPEDAWAMDGVEYYGYLSFLKAGLQHANALTTVSPSYAREIQTPSEGMGLDRLLRFRAARLTGIVNGIDTGVWDPANDPHLVHPFDAKRLTKKSANTAQLRQEIGLSADFDGPVLGVVSRLTTQKGVDLIPPLADRLALLPVQLAVLGNGDKDLEAAFLAMAARYPGQFAVRIGFDEGLAHRIEAGADLFLMPSRFEPCGLNQLYSLRYGTPPIVRATGGLADTVIDASDELAGTGFVFDQATPDALFGAVERAAATWRSRKRFAAIQRRGMSADYSWQRPAALTIAIYRSLRN